MKLDKFLGEKNKVKLSPTAISCYYECPRKFFYIYIRGIKEKPTPLKIRGKITHKVLENFFDLVNFADIKEQPHWRELWKKFKDILFSLLDAEWRQIGKVYEDCFESENQKNELLMETKDFLDFYAGKLAFSLTNKMKELDKNSEWFEQYIKTFFYPKVTEMKLKLDDEGMTGFVDKIMSVFGKGIAIVDYKTSKCPLPHYIPQSHLKQGKAYAFLWKELFGELPMHVSFYYLRTGESVYYPISERDIEEIRRDIRMIRLKKPVISEFPKKESKLCRFCDFRKICFKED